jgi:alkylation response protein AidB-like acyl-CoA dehydrogenase
MGIKIAKKEQKLGIRASSTCTISFDDVKIPEENIIGGEGKGYKIAIEILNEGRIGIAAQMLGLAQGAFDKAVPYTFERKQFGQSIGTFQAVAHQQAQAAIEIESARLLTYNAARRKEEGLPFTKEAAMAKYWASVVAQRVSGQAIEWAGGVGFTRETGIEKFWRDSKIVSSYLSVRTSESLTLINRALSTREHPIFNSIPSRSLSRKSTHNHQLSYHSSVSWHVRFTSINTDLSHTPQAPKDLKFRMYQIDVVLSASRGWEHKHIVIVSA